MKNYDGKYDATNMNNSQKWNLKGNQSEEIVAKAIQKEAKRCKRAPQGSHKDANREPEGAKRAPGSIYLCFTRFKGDQGHPGECTVGP